MKAEYGVSEQIKTGELIRTPPRVPVPVPREFRCIERHRTSRQIAITAACVFIPSACMLLGWLIAMIISPEFRAAVIDWSLR
jgi:hypothetical protein